MSVTYIPASQADMAALTEIFNKGYAGYILPVNLTEAQLTGHIRQNAVDLDKSRIALRDGEAVGIALLGVRGNLGWIGGVGVYADQRKAGIGRGLMNAAIDEARRAGLQAVMLEVIQGNDAAYKLYLDLGFTTLRRLLILNRAPAPLEIESLPVRTISPAEALAHFETFHATTVPWQRHPEGLNRDGVTIWGVGEAGLSAYIAGTGGETGLNVLDTGFAPNQPDSLRGLLAALHQQYPAATGRMVNLGEDDPAWPIFAEFGYVEQMAQYEMRLRL